MLEVGDGAVDEDTFGVVAGGMPREDGIASCGEDEDVVGDFFTGGAGDGFGGRVDGCYEGVEVVGEGPIWDSLVLFYPSAL